MSFPGFWCENEENTCMTPQKGRSHSLNEVTTSLRLVPPLGGFSAFISRPCRPLFQPLLPYTMQLAQFSAIWQFLVALLWLPFGIDDRKPSLLLTPPPAALPVTPLPSVEESLLSRAASRPQAPEHSLEGAEVPCSGVRRAREGCPCR